MAHPLQKFAYCPVCGSANWHENNFKSKHCADCGFTYYANPSSATAAFIRNSRGQLLVVRRAQEPAKGTLDLPGGFVDMDETGEEAICREIAEETGLRVSKPRYLFSLPNLYLYSGMTIHTLDMFYEVRVPDDVEVHAADDAAECLWLMPGDLKAELFGLQSISRAVAVFIDQLQ